MKTKDFDDFEDVEDYAMDLANFTDHWLIEDKTIFSRCELSERNKKVFQKRLHQILVGYYDDFINEMSPELFIEMERENLDQIKSGDFEDYDENMGSPLVTINDFLIKNKDEICAVAALELEAIIRNNMHTYRIIE
jgi:hypothetical protein